MAHGFGQSPPCPLGAPSSTQKQIPNARLVAFSNVGSSIQLLIPDRCLEEVLDFLEISMNWRPRGDRARGCVSPVLDGFERYQYNCAHR